MNFAVQLARAGAFSGIIDAVSLISSQPVPVGINVLRSIIEPPMNTNAR